MTVFKMPKGLMLLGVVGLCLVVPATPAAAAESPADWMYSPRTVSEIDLTLPPASWKTLEEHPEDEYVPGAFSIAETDGVPGTAGSFTAPIEVGVRLKGGAFGSLRTLDQKAAFKIKFDAFVEGQTFLGLEKLTLNNMVEDPSMVHETTAYEAFRALGVPSPHAGFAYLRVNGESFGLHLNIETQDKIALEKQFGPFFSPPQHLYEGEYGADVTPGRFKELEVDEGKKKEKGDLEALVAAVAGPNPSFSSAVGPLADLGEMSRMWAVEKYVGHWDGYSGRAGEKQPNNYYLYSDPSGRFQMLPWGTDETWAEHVAFEGAGGVLFNGCIGDAECKTTYRQALTSALATLGGLGLDDSVRCTAQRLQSWQELEAAERSVAHPERVPFGAEEIAEEVDATREFVAERPGELASFLGALAPASPPSQPCPPPTQRRDHEAPPATGSTAAQGTGVSSAPLSSVASLRLVRSRVGGLAVHLQVASSAAGKVALYGWVGAGKGHADVCAARTGVAAAGTTEITCRLTEPVLRRRAKRWLRLHLKLDFVPPSGAAQEIRRDLILRRH